MTKPEAMDSGSAVSGLLRQAIAFVRDFAAFAGCSGVIAAALAVLAAIFEGADEATSAIDVPTERQIIKTMLDLKPTACKTAEPSPMRRC